MPNRTPKNAKDFLTFCEDQGIPNLCGASARGVSIQYASFVMGSAPDDFVFAENGLQDMEGDNYVVLPWNQTDVADQGVISAKTGKQFTITGPDAADVVDLLIVGQLKGQLA